MNSLERQNALSKIENTASDSEKEKAVSFLVSAAGSIPLAGGAISGAGQKQEREKQTRFNLALFDLTKANNEEIESILKAVEVLERKPNFSRFTNLIQEVFPFIPKEGQGVPVVLNSATIGELKEYEELGWLKMEPTHSTTNMGAGNRVGNHIEEQKRPWGMGNGFVVTIPTWDIQTYER